MKKQLTAIGLAVLVLSGLSAQGFGPGAGAAMEWQEGASILTEYRSLSGTLLIGDRLVPVFKVGTQEYQLHLPRTAQQALASVKNGDTLTMAGLVITRTAADKSKTLIFRPTKATIGGKEIILQDPQSRMGGRRGQGAYYGDMDRPGATNGQGMGRGPGRGR